MISQHFWDLPESHIVALKHSLLARETSCLLEPFRA